MTCGQRVTRYTIDGPDRLPRYWEDRCVKDAGHDGPCKTEDGMLFPRRHG